jgi:pyrroloquinoline quinone biosynthesis protein E
MAEALGADYIELANNQYYGWSLVNRSQLMPTREQLERAEAVTNQFRAKGTNMKIFYVVPDYFNDRPKKCMNGWGEVFMIVTANGDVLPCHSARSLPNMQFPNVKDADLGWSWKDSPAFNQYRGDSWMKEPCRSCDEKEKDLGGCRCQSFLLTGDAEAADPVCSKSPHRHLIDQAIEDAKNPQIQAQPILFRNDKNSKRIISGELKNLTDKFHAIP